MESRSNTALCTMCVGRQKLDLSADPIQSSRDALFNSLSALYTEALR